jgi:hypothetical protein
MASDSLGAASVRFLPDEAMEVQGVKVGDVQELHEFWWAGIADVPGFLRGLPEMSEIRDPKTTERLKEYHKKTIPWWFPGGVAPPEIIDIEVDGCMLKHQSRFEVFWRTLLNDCLDGQHPAPAECASALHAKMESIMTTRMIVAAASLMPNTDDWKHLPASSGELGNLFKATVGNWETAKTQVGKDYTAWQVLLGHHPYDNSNDLIFPPEFQSFFDSLEAARLLESELRCALHFFNKMSSRLKGQQTSTKQEADVKKKILNFSAPLWKLFMTSQGHLGNGYLSIEAGDQIWVLVGASVPFVLRPLDGGKYRLMGEAYVHGIMHGEAVSDSNTNTQTIVLI